MRSCWAIAVIFALGACSGPGPLPSTDAGGSGARAGGFGSTAGGAGGGSSATAGGSAAGGSTAGGSADSGTPDAGGRLECPLAHREDHGTCKPAEWMQLAAFHAKTIQIDGGSSLSTSASLSFFRADGGLVWTPPLAASEGLCTAYAYDAGGPFPPSPISGFCTNVGVISVSGGPRPFTLAPLPTSSCYTSSLDGGLETIFQNGATLSISAPGSTQFPAFTATLPSPAQLDLQVGTLTRGQPLMITWNAAASAEPLWVTGYTIDTASTHYFQCFAPDTGSLVVPASITSTLLPRSATQSYVLMQRRSIAQIEPASSFVVERVYLGWQVMRDVRYQP